MPKHGLENTEHNVVSLGDDQVMRHLEGQFPDAIAAAHKRIALMPPRLGLIDQITPADFEADRSDEIAIVGKTK